MRFNHPYLIAFAVLIILWFFYRILTGNWNPFKLVRGADGRPSTSKLQFFLWTVVVLFTYVAFYAARVNNSVFGWIDEIPGNLLIAMGFSVVTAAAAKGITVSYLESGSVTKAATAPEEARASDVLRNDDGSFDLTKVQMLAWTLVAIGVYLCNAVNAISHHQWKELPDIDGAMMVLMGLSQGGYLGKKLVTTGTPGVTAVVPDKGKGGADLTLNGVSFGDKQGGSMITFDGQPREVAVASWGDTQIKFKFPDKQPDGADWGANQRVVIGVIVNGQKSPGGIPFIVTP